MGSTFFPFFLLRASEVDEVFWGFVLFTTIHNFHLSWKKRKLYPELTFYPDGLKQRQHHSQWRKLFAKSPSWICRDVWLPLDRCNESKQTWLCLLCVCSLPSPRVTFCLGNLQLSLFCLPHLTVFWCIPAFEAFLTERNGIQELAIFCQHCNCRNVQMLKSFQWCHSITANFDRKQDHH